jgi:hypothetical protein
MAAVHMISTLKDFVVMENHAVDIPWWGDLITGPAKPIIQNGYIQVPETPGIGVDLMKRPARRTCGRPGISNPLRSSTNTSLTSTAPAARIRTLTRTESS